MILALSKWVKLLVFPACWGGDKNARAKKFGAPVPLYFPPCGIRKTIGIDVAG